ncbi:MAG: CocE/NonD family hydrolase [Candidatus Solibacter usitatus]|nr:CocE/NonD family hydrolase [Candidatus Solibacter usitatus]
MGRWFALALLPLPLLAYDVKQHYQKAEHMVPMRDGVRLHTTIYSPRRSSEKLPFLMVRTPYGTGPYGAAAYRTNLGPSPHSFEFEEEGFIFVFQDVRGKFKSEGEFTVMRPHKPDKRGAETDESSDTYDTIEWLLQNIPNHNGRAGQLGTSYPGFQTVHGMIDAHPALKASSPQASPSDMFIGDDFHHNGAFRLAYTFGWLSRNASARSGPSDQDAYAFDPGTPDGYRFFLDLGPLANANQKYLKGRVPEWNNYMEHPDYDEFWRKQNPLPHLKNIRHPVLNVAAWFDAEDFYGPMTIYQQIEKLNPNNQSVLVVGPWSHGGWNGHLDGGMLGPIQFGGEPARYFREKVQFPFFRYHLKGKGDLRLPEVLAYESGAGEWRSYDRWPPRQAVEHRLYFEAGGKLSWDQPEEYDEWDSYLSDPRRPVPSSGATLFMPGHVWMVEDQRFSATRPDVLAYETGPLTEPVTVAGHVVARLYASTSGTDSDFIVKLIDVFPGDAPDNKPNPASVRMGHYQMLVSGEVFRAKYRNSFSKPEPMVPDEPARIEIDLRDKNHRFLKGHRIMVHVQSTWFPVIDRNPQVFTNIYQAAESDFRPAEQRIYRSRNLPSHVEVSTLN